MNGKFVLDSTIFIDILNKLEGTEHLKEKLKDAERYISVITRMEVLSYPAAINDDIENRIQNLLSEFSVIPLDDEVEKTCIAIRRTKSLKLPDAIIAATAFTLGATVLSRDEHLLELDWPGLPVVSGL
jgi:predicted nucleic acid-binding protein